MRWRGSIRAARGLRVAARARWQAPMAALRRRCRFRARPLPACCSLEEYALAFDTFSSGQRIALHPPETLANLKRAEARPQVTAWACARNGRRDAMRPADTTFLWDLIVLVAAAGQQEIELTRSGSLPKRAAQRLLPFLTGERARISEDEALAYVELLRQEASELGLVAARGNGAKTRARLVPGPKLDSWARHDLVMQARRIFRRWPTDRWWSDLAGANYHEWQTFYLDMPVAREAAHELLLTLRAGRLVLTGVVPRDDAERRPLRAAPHPAPRGRGWIQDGGGPARSSGTPPTARSSPACSARRSTSLGW